MSDEPAPQHKAAIPENEPFRAGSPRAIGGDLPVAAGQPEKKGVPTLLATGLFMAVTMFSFEAVKQA